jgi:hypothetical protein
LEWNSAVLCGQAQGHHSERDDYNKLPPGQAMEPASFRLNNGKVVITLGVMVPVVVITLRVMVREICRSHHSPRDGPPKSAVVVTLPVMVADVKITQDLFIHRD